MHHIDILIVLARISEPNNVNVIKTNCKYFASQRLAMFKAALEFHLFKTLIKDNDDVLYNEDTNRKSALELMNLKVPKKFTYNMGYRQKHKINTQTDTTVSFKSFLFINILFFLFYSQTSQNNHHGMFILIKNDN